MSVIHSYIINISWIFIKSQHHTAWCIRRISRSHATSRDESNKWNVNMCRPARALNHVVTASRVAAVQYYFILFLWQDDDKRQCGQFAHSSSAWLQKQLKFSPNPPNFTEKCRRRQGIRKYYNKKNHMPITICIKVCFERLYVRVRHRKEKAPQVV